MDDTEFLLPDYQDAFKKVEAAKILRKRQLAESLMNQMPQGVRLGSAVVPPHWTSFLASGINQGLGREAQHEADSLETQLLNRLKAQDEAQQSRATSFLTNLTPTAADLANPLTKDSARKAVELAMEEPYDTRKAVRVAEAKLADESRENTEWDRRNDVTSRQALERARVQAGIQQATEANKPPTESERKASDYFGRMQESEAIINGIGPKGYPDAASTAVSGIGAPGSTTNAVAQTVSRSMQTPEQQRYWNAAKVWAAAKLRWESGAIISDKEAAEEAARYFPMIGDKPDVIAQKELMRRRANEGMRLNAGRGAANVTPPQVPQAPQQIGTRTFRGTGEIKGTQNDPVPVASQADYDVLDSGTYYTANGKLYRKGGR